MGRSPGEFIASKIWYYIYGVFRSHTQVKPTMNHSRGVPGGFYSTLKRMNELLFFVLARLTPQSCVCWDNMSCDCLWFPHSGTKQWCWGSGLSQLHRQSFEICPILPGSWLRVETGSKCSLHTVLKHSLDLISADSFHWKPLDELMGWKTRLLLIPCA